NGTPSAVAYAEAASYMLGVNNSDLTYSGVNFAPSGLGIYNTSTKKYNSPISQADFGSTCNGHGIYFLTDGYANNSRTTVTTNLMNRALGESLSGTGLPGDETTIAYLINDYYYTNQGWNEIGKFSKLL